VVVVVVIVIVVVIVVPVAVVAAVTGIDRQFACVLSGIWYDLLYGLSRLAIITNVSKSSVFLLQLKTKDCNLRLIFPNPRIWIQYFVIL